MPIDLEEVLAEIDVNQITNTELLLEIIKKVSKPIQCSDGLIAITTSSDNGNSTFIPSEYTLSSLITAISSSANPIDDSQTSLNKTWSSSKISGSLVSGSILASSSLANESLLLSQSISTKAEIDDNTTSLYKSWSSSKISGSFVSQSINLSQSIATKAEIDDNNVFANKVWSSLKVSSSFVSASIITSQSIANINHDDTKNIKGSNYHITEALYDIISEQSGSLLVSSSLGINTTTPQFTTDISGSLRTTSGLYFGGSATSSIDYTHLINISGSISGSNNVNSLVFTPKVDSTASFTFKNANGTASVLNIDTSTGALTMSSLIGTGDRLIKTSATGALSAATAGTDYQMPIGTLPENKIVVGGGSNAVKSSGVSITAINKVYLLGDSTTYAPMYSETLRKLLPNNFTVVNKGIPGNYTNQMLSRLNTDVLDNLDCDYIVVLGGSNDLAVTTPAEIIKSNLQNIYTNCHNAGIKVIAITTFRWDLTATQQTILESVNAWIKDTAINVDYVIDAYSIFEDPNNLTKLLPIYNYGDNAHLSEIGNKKLAEIVYAGVTWNYRYNVNNNYNLSLKDTIILDQNVSTLSTPTYKGLILENDDNVSTNKLLSSIATAKLLQCDHINTGYDEQLSNLHYAFKIKAIDNISLYSIDLKLKSVGTITNPTGTITLNIYSDNSNKPDQLLYTTSNVKYGGITSSYLRYSFAKEISLVSNTDYWIDIKLSAAVAGGTLYVDRGATQLTTTNVANPIMSDWTVYDGSCYYSLYDYSNYGVYGSSRNSYGVFGYSTNAYGIFGYSTNADGVSGNSVNSHGVYGYSKNAYGVYGISTNSYGVYGSSTSAYGVYGNSINGTGVYGNSTSSYGLSGSSTNGTGGYIRITGAQTANNSGNVLLLSRISSGAFNATGNMLRLEDNPTVSGTISGALISGTIGTTERLRFDPRVLDGATAVGTFIDTKNALSTPGAKLLSLRNSGTRKHEIDWDGSTNQILGTYNYYNATLGTPATNDKATSATSTAFNWYNYTAGDWSNIASLSNTGQLTLIDSGTINLSNNVAINSTTNNAISLSNTTPATVSLTALCSPSLTLINNTWSSSLEQSVNSTWRLRLQSYASANGGSNLIIENSIAGRDYVQVLAMNQVGTFNTVSLINTYQINHNNTTNTYPGNASAGIKCVASSALSTSTKKYTYGFNNIASAWNTTTSTSDTHNYRWITDIFSGSSTSSTYNLEFLLNSDSPILIKKFDSNGEYNLLGKYNYSLATNVGATAPTPATNDKKWGAISTSYNWYNYTSGDWSLLATLLNNGSLGLLTTPTSTLHVNGSVAASYVAKTADYTLTASDYTVDCTTNTFTVTLPTAVGCKDRIYNIKNSGTGVITVVTTNSETIDGETSQLLDIQYDSLQLQSTGSNWIII